MIWDLFDQEERPDELDPGGALDSIPTLWSGKHWYPDIFWWLGR